MSTGDFEANLRQSVQDHLAAIRDAASAAKARIGQGTAPGRQLPAEPSSFVGAGLRPAVNFDAEEPAYHDQGSAFDTGGPGSLPEGAIAFEHLAFEGGDDESIPVWEDAP